MDLNPYRVADRDWTIDELEKICVQAEDYSFATNHHINWDSKIIKKFKDNGWFTFTFLRRPEEVLCSLYCFSTEQNLHIRGGGDNEPKSLEEMFDYAVRDTAFAKVWKAPDYLDQLDYVAEFNEENFSIFLLEHFGEVYEPRPRANTSLNKGFNYFREAGEISDEVAQKLFDHPEYKKHLSYL